MDRAGQPSLYWESGRDAAARADSADRALWERLLGWLPLLVSFGLGTAALCSAALINGGPIMYPDTLNYLADGHALVRLTTPDNTRPVFYGVAIELLHWEWLAWPVIVAQALIITHLVYLTMRAVLGVVTPIMLLLAIASLVILTPVSWYVAHLLPDVFSGVVILGMFLLTFGHRRMRPVELGYLTALTAAGICFHLTNFVTGAALCGGAHAEQGGADASNVRHKLQHRHGVPHLRPESQHRDARHHHAAEDRCWFMVATAKGCGQAAMNRYRRSPVEL